MSREYMTKLRSVIFETANPTGLDDIGNQLKERWQSFESTMRNYSYDVFVSVPVMAMVDQWARVTGALLYQVPGAYPNEDCETLERKDKDYGGSWCRRGGIGAFMMAARKWDRIETQLLHCAGSLEKCMTIDRRAEGIADDIADLRCYLMLWRAYIAIELETRS